MSEPHEPIPDAGGQAAQPRPPQAGAQPSTEPEPTPSAATSADPPAPEAPTAAMFAGPPAGRYVWVPAGPPRGFGPAFGRFVRRRATHLAAAVVVGALVGGGTVATVDNYANHQQSTFSREGQTGDPFGGGSGHRFPGYGFGGGGQGSGN